MLANAYSTRRHSACLPAPGSVPGSATASGTRAPLAAAVVTVAVTISAIAASALLIATVAEAASSKGNSNEIVVLVNDEPITAYEIEQRQRLLALSANISERAQNTFKALLKRESTTNRLKEILNQVIKQHQAKGRDAVIKIFEQRKKEFAVGLQKQAIEGARAGVLPGLKRTALQELIDERLKVQEAKRNNVVVTDEQISRIVNGIASRNKMNEAQFAKHLAGMGVDINTMRQRFKAASSWNDVIRRRFGYQIAISERDVDRFVDPSLGGGPEAAVPSELVAQRVVFPISGNIEQKIMAERLSKADALRRAFSGCKSTEKLAKSAGATFQNLGAKNPSSIGEPTRTMLLSAKDGEMIPPNVGPDGIELWAVCGRKAGPASAGGGPGAQQAPSAKDERRQKELDILAKRHLKDLRQDATIDCRAEPKSGICSLL